jgi:hypothetical protein
MNSKTKSSPSSKSTTTTQSTSHTKVQDRFQFVRETGYARVKPHGVQWSAGDIVDEALRRPGHCGHVSDPSPPIGHFGIEPQNLERFVLELEGKSQTITVPTARGRRKQRSDTPILIGIVLSHPMPPSKRQAAEVQEWICRAIEWLREWYGDDHLVCVLEHVDEGHVHLHAYVHNGGASVKPLMAGHRAAKAAKSTGATRKAQHEAYRSGTTLLQDSFYEAVSRPLGMGRKSPSPKPRVSRSAILDQKQVALDKQKEQLSDERERQAKVRELLHQREVLLHKSESAVQAHKAELDDREVRLKEDRAKLERQMIVFREVAQLLPPDQREYVLKGIGTLADRERSGATPAGSRPY